MLAMSFFQIKCGATFEDPLSVCHLVYVLSKYLTRERNILADLQISPRECAE